VETDTGKRSMVTPVVVKSGLFKSGLIKSGLFKSGLFKSGLWTVLVRWTSLGLSRIDIIAWPGKRDGGINGGGDLQEPGLSERARSSSGLATMIISSLHGYLSGEAQECRLPLDLTECTVFQREVYQAAQKIAAGSVATYGQVASACGRPGGARAVGQALSKNPIPIIIPCHRVIARNGIGGFSGGIDLKKALLHHEGWKGTTI